jgi:hypothetical protein
LHPLPGNIPHPKPARPFLIQAGFITNDGTQLGRSIYFWEGNPGRALEWAEYVRRNPKVSRDVIREPFVIGAIIDPGDCLDLLQTDGIRIIDESYQQLAATFRAAEIPLPKNQRKGNEWAIRRLDCAVVNHVHHTRAQGGNRPFDTVRAAFEEGAPLYPTAGFHRRTHIHLCVRNTAQIVGYFRPLGD